MYRRSNLGFVGPRRRTAPPPPPPPPLSPAAALFPAPRVSTPQPFISYYSPTRIFEDIKVVADLRQNGFERGETQTGDDGALGPLEDENHYGDDSISPPQPRGKVSMAPAPKMTGLQMALLAGAAFLLFGG